jgi:hypothetical protein
MQSLNSMIFRAKFVYAVLLILTMLMTLSFKAEANDWQVRVAKIAGLAKQVESLDEEIHGLIRQKKHLKNPEEIKTVLHEMTTKYKTLSEKSKELEREAAQARFKFPDRDLNEKRKYLHHRLKSLEEMEAEMGLDGRLDRAKARVLVTFPIPNSIKKPDADKSEAGMRLPASRQGAPLSSHEDEEEEAQEQITLRVSAPTVPVESLSEGHGRGTASSETSVSGHGANSTHGVAAPIAGVRSSSGGHGGSGGESTSESTGSSSAGHH